MLTYLFEELFEFILNLWMMVDLLVFLVVCQEGLWYFTAYFLANLPSAVLTLYQFQYFWEVFAAVSSVYIALTILK